MIRYDGLHFSQAGMDLLAPAITDAIIAAARSTGIPPVVTEPPSSTVPTPIAPTSELAGP